MNKILTAIIVLLIIICGVFCVYRNSPDVFIKSIYNCKTPEDYYKLRIMNTDYSSTLSSVPDYLLVGSTAKVTIVREEEYKDGYVIIEYNVMTDNGYEFVGMDLWCISKGRKYYKNIHLTQISDISDIAY